MPYESWIDWLKTSLDSDSKNLPSLISRRVSSVYVSEGAHAEYPFDLREEASNIAVRRKVRRESTSVRCRESRIVAASASGKTAQCCNLVASCREHLLEHLEDGSTLAESQRVTSPLISTHRC